MNTNKFKSMIAGLSLFLGTTLALQSNIFATEVIPTYVEGQKIQYNDVIPYITNNSRVMLPFRVIGEELGIEFDWDAPTVTATGIHMETGKYQVVKLSLDSNTMLINNVPIKIQDEFELKDNRTFLPIRLFSESFGYNVEWKNKAVYITNPVQPEPPTSPEVPNNNIISPIESEILNIVNEERAKVGAQPLQLDMDLSKIADIKSQDMYNNNYFDHTSPTYGSPFDMLKQFGINYKSAGENIIYGYKSADTIMNAWLNSPGHRANILNANYTHIGIGVDTRGYHGTQLFINK